MNKLLELLSRNAEFTTAQLATMLGQSEDEVKKQIADYKEQGIIKGSTTLINWDKVPEAGVMALIELKVTPKAETGFDDIARIVMSYDNVESVYLAASSRYDLIAMVKGSTIQEIAEFVSKRLSTLDNVIGTATSFVLTHYKSGGVSFYDSDEDREQRSMIL
ncbi:MAG: Lrp/AsnC family transcriptional regulator [Clostridia bacterium]|nr:Lrp/AsnC family transcriptional regulator [Clostridia bacterium]HCA56001.1 AsnC family transcriptional regulator [Oscillospiraceae bacterium]